jgi:osmotically-inducible protein OsmY
MKRASQVTIRAALFASLLLSAWALASAQDPAGQSNNPQADNTKMNQRDRNANEPTADQQKSNRSDRDITQQVRKAIMEDKSLSTYAHNVKIITQNGMVTLKGPVRSEEEKRAIEAKAAEVAGGDKVTNEIDVKQKQ